MKVDIREHILSVVAVGASKADAAGKSVSGDDKFLEAPVPLQVDRRRTVYAAVHVGACEAQVAEFFEL